MQRNDLHASLRNHILAVAGASVALVASVGIMGASTEMSGAVVSAGSLVVESSVKKVQHQTGGIVKELAVAEGQKIAEGDLLVRLDETVANANLSAISKSYWELLSRRARLEAERDGGSEPVFPDELIAVADDPSVQSTILGERRLLKLRTDASENRKKQLRERIQQLHEEIGGLGEQLRAKEQELALIQKELTGVESLWEQKLVSISRISTLQREAARLLGDKGQLIASIARSKGRISETELQIIQIDDEFRRDVAKELADIRAKCEEAFEKRVAAQDVVTRIDIRSPQKGVVHDLALHTRGGVVAPGETLMLIVPDADELIVETRIAPQDIDQIRPAQDVVLRLPNFNQRTTPELNGKVSRIGADISRDDKTGPGYFVVRVAIAPEEARRLGNVRLVPGMPVDVFVQTSKRTLLSYLTRPLADQISRAFREK